MSITNRTVTNTVTGETITFLETSAETGGVRVVAQITLTPGGSVIPHSHRVSESFECLDGSFITHLAGKETEFLPGQRMIAEPHEMHGFRNDTAQPATLKVTATPAGDLDRTLRTLSGLSRDGLLVPGKPPGPTFCYGESCLEGPLLSAAVTQMALLDDDGRHGSLWRALVIA
jgi:quercetin dioxygenase-like cupin family protein